MSSLEKIHFSKLFYAICLLANLVAFGGLLVVFFNHNRTLENSYRSTLEQTTAIAEKILRRAAAPDQLEDLLRHEPAQYWELQQQFRDLQEATGVSYLYVADKHDGDWRFLLSSLYGRGTNVATILAPHPEYNEDVELNRAWDERAIIFHNFTDRWGDLVIVSRPFVVNGKTVGVIGADFDRRTVSALHARVRNELLITLCATAVLSLLLWYKVYSMMRNLGNAVAERTQSLREQTELAHAAYFAKTNFLATLSHELRTPLHAINGMASIARTAVDNPPKIIQCLDNINVASECLTKLFTNLLTAVQLETGKCFVAEQEFNFRQMLDRLIAQFTKISHYKKQSFKFEVAPTVPTYVLGDEMQLSRCVQTLLDNAVKFTPEHGTIALTVEAMPVRKNCVRVIVADTGIGIAPERQRRVFLLFEQGDNGLTRKYEGTGLGLTIVKGLLDLMGGTIQVNSKIGVGTTFTMELPLTPIESLMPLPPEQSDIFHGKRVLLAEDNEINRQEMLTILTPTGMEVDCAESGDLAVEMFTDRPDAYDLILMDNYMPEMDGIEAARRIRQTPHPRAKTIPIIAVSGDRSPESIAQYFHAGMNDHLDKPVDDAVLIAKIVHYLYGGGMQLRIKN
ncbi:hypothetical protein FACS1894139_09660 [Planctomycetales bacterium]|nr:hypothetical protein FACS1894107_00740 [Planctomycetales bacterium]GHT05587.1 hypothetical protein FACS1894139_09660 [Planctomycetales bacterium]